MVSDNIRVVPETNTIVKIVNFLGCEKVVFTPTRSVCSLNCVARIVNAKRMLIFGLF
jgi:hypothetical protein